MIIRRLGSGFLGLGAVAVVVAAGTAAAMPGNDGASSGSAGRQGPVSLAGPLGDGTPGYCPNKKGVTVVVDFNQLGGGIVVRCAPGPIGSDYTGLDALEDAGFRPSGTTRWGLEFICRIAGKPDVNQKLHIKGDPNYKEKCVDTPPPEAFWSYWYAPNGGSWTLSAEGPANHDVIPGGFEGWSFSLNHTQDTAPAPGINPQRPQRPPHSTQPTSPPTRSSPPPTHPTHGGGGHRGGSGGSGGSTPTTPTAPPSTSAPPAGPTGAEIPQSRALKHHGARAYGSTLSASPAAPTWSETANPVALGHNAAGEKVSGQLPGTAAATSSGSPRAAVAGVLLLAVLAAGGYVAWWRRRTGPG